MEEGIPVWKCLVLIVRGVGTMVEGCVELVGRVVARDAFQVISAITLPVFGDKEVSQGLERELGLKN